MSSFVIHKDSEALPRGSQSLYVGLTPTGGRWLAVCRHYTLGPRGMAELGLHLRQQFADEGMEALSPCPVCRMQIIYVSAGSCAAMTWRNAVTPSKQ